MSKLRLQAKTKGISSRRPTVSARAVDRLTFLHSILLPALIFLLTALIGVWAAYDRTVAWTRFSLIVGGLVFAVVIFWGGRRTLDRSTTWVLQVGGVLAPVVGILWLISRLWGDPLLHDNAAGGALAVTIPFAIAGAYSAWRRRSLAMVAVLGAGVIGAGVALALSQSRGAWLGLLAGAVVAALVERRGLSRRSTYFALIGTATLFVAAFAIVVSVPAFERTIQTAGADGSTLGRVHVWRDMLVLIQDYPLTGSGLAGTAMVYSSYVLLLHVPFLYHAHNLFLQIAVEQGLIGMGAFVGLAAMALYSLLRSPVTSEHQRWFRTAAIASLVAVLVHGMFDAELYVSWLAPLVFLPIGSALLLAPISTHAVSRNAMVLRAGWVVAGVLLVGILAPHSRSMIHANLGAVHQTRTELSVYRWPEWPIQDAVRRASVETLAPAVAHYEAALSLNPNNVTANRRLGQIELSHGKYGMACQHLATAYEASRNPGVTRQMLGECYAVVGKVEQAATLWRTADVGQTQFKLRQWWYNHIGESERAARLVYASER